VPINNLRAGCVQGRCVTNKKSDLKSSAQIFSIFSLPKKRHYFLALVGKLAQQAFFLWRMIGFKLLK